MIIGKEENKDMLTPKFNVGEEICVVEAIFEKESRPVKCSVCKSTGKVKIKNEYYKCPSCNGKTELFAKDPKYIVAYENAKIGMIRTEEYSENYIKKERYKNNIHYMIEPTGIGSGRFYVEGEALLFKTPKEAEDFCKKYVPEKPGQINTNPVLKKSLKRKGPSNDRI